MTYLLSFRRFTEILLGTLDFSSSRNDKPGSYLVTIPKFHEERDFFNFRGNHKGLPPTLGITVYSAPSQI